MAIEHIALEEAARLKGISYQTLKKQLQRARVVLRNDDHDRRRKLAPLAILSGRELQLWLRERVSALPDHSPSPESETLALRSETPEGDSRLSRAGKLAQPLLPFARPSGAQTALVGIPLKFQVYVDKWLTFMGEVQNGEWKRREGLIIHGSTVKSRADYIRAIAPQWGLSVTEFYRKQQILKQIQRNPSIPEGEKWGAWAKTLIPKPRPGRASASYFNQKENAWQFGKLCEFYLNQAKLSLRMARHMLLAEIDARQRVHGLGHLYDKPSLSQCYTALKNFISPSQKMLARQGEKSWNDRFAPYLSRNYSSLQSNDLWVTDQRQVDVRLRDGGERLGRIWMVSFMDVASERILGCAFGPVLSSDLVMLAATMALGRGGVPGAIQMDLGKEFNCTAFNGSYRKLSGEALYREAVGLWERLQARVVKAIGRNPQTKTIERWHRIIGEQFDRRLPGWCGSNTLERPEKLASEETQHEAWKRGERNSTPLISLWDYITAFFYWLDSDPQGWNQGARGKGKIRKGMTPLEAWNVKRPEAGLRTMAPDQLEIATAEHRFVKVARGGQVNLTFFGQTVEYIAPELMLRVGEPVEAIVSRRTFRKITVSYPVPGGTAECTAEIKPQMEWLPENREELRAAMRCKAAVRRAIRQGAKASHLSLVAANPVELLAAQSSAPARETLPGQKLFGAPAPAREISSSEYMMEKLARRGKSYAPKTLTSEEVAEKMMRSEESE